MAFLTRTALAAVISTAICAPALAASPIAAQKPWIRAIPGGMTAAGYVTLVNTGAKPDRLTGASSPAAGMVMVHQSVNEGGMAKMKHIPALELAPGKPVAMAPGGYHIMLMMLKQPMPAGTRVPITLTFAASPPVTVNFPVQDAAPK